MKSPLIRLANIGLISIELFAKERERKEARNALIEAKRDFRNEADVHGIIERDSDEYNVMMAATQPQRAIYEAAYQDWYNTKQRLNRAIQAS